MSLVTTDNMDWWYFRIDSELLIKTQSENDILQT